MPRKLDDIRKDIDEFDEFIVRSFFDWFAPDKNPGVTIIKPDEVNRLLSTKLRFSDMTWQLINARMKLSREVWENKKAAQIDVVVDKKRYEVVIAKAQSHAPVHAREEVRKLYNLIHDISVRIQKEIINQP